MGAVTETRTYGDVLTATLANYQKTLTDNVYNVYPALSWLNGTLGEKTRKAKKIKKVLSGGESIVVNILFGKNTTAKPYAGAEPLDTTPQETTTRARFDWKQYGATISITGLDLRNNSGREQILNILEDRTKEAEASLRDVMNPHVFGDGTAYNSKALTGFQALISATSTLGGISVAAVPQWKSIMDTGGFSWAAQGRAKLRTMVNNLTYGNDGPDAIFTDQTTFESIEASFDDKERLGVGGAVDMGFNSIAYKGTMITWDRNCPSGHMYFLNSRYINFNVHAQADMKPGKFVQPHGQDVLTAHIIFQGNLSINNRRMFGLITGITA